MDPSVWNPVSIATLVISLLAIGLGVLNLVQAERHHAKPKLVFDWQPGSVWSSDNSHPVATVRVRNDGSAAARGLRYWLSTAVDETHPERPVNELDVLEPGDDTDIEVPLYNIVFTDDVMYRSIKAGENFGRLQRPKVTVRYADHRPVESTAPAYAMPGA